MSRGVTPIQWGATYEPRLTGTVRASAKGGAFLLDENLDLYQLASAYTVQLALWTTSLGVAGASGGQYRGAERIRRPR